uniref:Protein TIC 214 n=2 Tax=Tarenaya hassleriana TaxID=28532 RepID=A0A1U9S0I5_9ROSI|nr:Ycf1 [Tarenaya hassleriana]AQV10748.1 Ycf1 [Tarenaya hassleriana]
MMVFQSFILGNLVSLCMKIINSVVVVGLYYGFLTTFSIGPSYLFLLRARVMDEGEEGTEKKVSATTGFIAGQLMMFISIYYAPLHLALGRPHTITVLALPYLLFHFFWNNHKHFFDYGSTTRNSMRNLRIQCVFLNNLIFQLFNHFILPSSMLARLVNIYMFRCNNKMLFVTSSFVGWLIGHILFMKWVGLVLVWIQQNHSIRSNVLIRSNKYKFLVSELRNSMARIFSILLFITCVYYLGRIPSPIFTKKLKGTSEMEERGGTKQDQEVSTEEAPFPSLFSEEREDLDKIDEMEEIRVNGKEKISKDDEFHVRTYYKTVYENLDGNQENSNFEIFKIKKKEDYLLWFEKPFVTLVFDYKRWNRPNRYIENDEFENAVRKEMSQYFFYTCQSDGKERISFTYPPNLSTFFEMIQKKIPSFTREKTVSDKFSTYWSLSNEQKKENLKKEFLNRIEALDKESSLENILEKKTRFCHNETKKEYLPKIYDPFLHGISRGKIKKLFLFPIITKRYIKNHIGGSWINKIHGILFNINSHKFEQTIEKFNKKSLSIEKRDKRLSFFSEPQQTHSEEEIKIFKFLFDIVITDSNDQTLIKNKMDFHEINKEVPRWSHKLISELEQLEGENEENVPRDPAIRSRKAKRVVIFTDKELDKDIYTNLDKDIYTNSKDKKNSDQRDEMALIRYSQQSDFRREIIKGSMRAQRRKTVIWKFLQANVHSPFFLDRINKPFFFSFFSFDIWGLMKKIVKNLMWKNKKKKIYNSKYTEEKTKKIEKKEEEKKEKSKREEKRRIEIAEAWDSLVVAQILRGFLLVTQLIFRKYIILPLLIIIKNIVRILLFQFPEWSEDLTDWKRETYVKCTYNGVPLSEREFPRNWLTDGIQIKILFPFCLKPWHKSKFQSSHKAQLKKTKDKVEKNDFCFLTVLGTETELLFGSARKQPSFFEPISKEFKKKMKKLKMKTVTVLRVFKEKTKIFVKIAKEIKNWIIKSLLFLKGKIKDLSKLNIIPLFGLRKIYELNETKKDSITNNQMIDELSVQNRSMEWTNSSLTENKMKNLIDRTKTIRNQIEQIQKKKKNITNSSNKPSYHSKKIESKKKNWQILKRKNTRLIRKSFFFIKFFNERVYKGILLDIINIPRITTQLFFESTKTILNKYIYKNEENEEKINKKKNTIYFISTLKNLLSNKKEKNEKICYDLSSLSQAYVFYKLSQIKVINFYKLKDVLQYNRCVTSFFVKNQIKHFFEEQGIFHYELKYKTFLNCEINEWKNWLKSHYQYNLPQREWTRLVSEKWRNKINQDALVPNKNLNKEDSYEKNQFYNYKKQNDFQADSLLNQKNNFKKDYIYNLFCYKSINSKEKKFDMPIGIPIDNYLVSSFLKKYNIRRGIGERKFLDWRILNFWFGKKVKIESWVDTKSKKNITTKVHNYQRIDKITKKGLANDNQKRNFFDWMGMNEEILSRHIANPEFWLFPEFLLFSSTYKKKPWIIPIKLLLFNFNENQNLNKNITKKKKGFIPSNEKKSLRFSNLNQEEKKSVGQGELESDKEKKRNPESVLSNQEKNIDKNYAESKIKKLKKKYKSNIEAELYLFFARYLRFQLRWNDFLNQKILNNVKVYCLLLRLKNPNEIAISSIQRGEMYLDNLIIEKNLTFAKLMKKRIFIIEPVRLSVKHDGQLIVYRTIGISLVHKKISQRYKKKSYIDKKNFDKSIPKYKKKTGTGNRKKNHYDFFVPENILSPKRRREFRILICLKLKNINARYRNSTFDKNIQNCDQVLNKKKNLDRDKNNLIKFKFFLWPNFRLEDLACMNRYWFNTNNGNNFSMLRIHMYPRFQIN